MNTYNNENESEKMVQIINVEALNQLGLENIGFGHIQIVCECGQKWGIRVNRQGYVAELNLHCYKCDAMKFNEMIK